jgi:hypothetical protein
MKFEWSRVFMGFFRLFQGTFTMRDCEGALRLPALPP